MSDVSVRAAGQPRRAGFSVHMVPYWGMHLVALAGVLWSGWSWTGLGLAAIFYFARMFFVTAGYHRYFSHRTFKVSRPVQLLLAIGAESSVQKGVLWWSANHRHHHKHSDGEEDIHSVRRDGFWWAHNGWILGKEYQSYDRSAVADLGRYPELRFIDRFWILPPVALAVVMYLVGGWHTLLWGFFVSTVLLWHGTFTINSLAHLIGRRRYETTDDSRNHWLLALITLGEGWHNNHHHYQRSANQGFFWWEVDVTYYVLRGLALLGVTRDVMRAPAHVVAGTRRLPVAPGHV